MSSGMFIWLEVLEDIDPVAKALGKPREEIKELLTANIHNDKNTVFHTGTGDQREIAKKTCSNYPKEYLEWLFIEDLYGKSNHVWENPYGSVVEAEDFIVFHLWGTLNGNELHQKIIIPKEDFNNVYSGTYIQQYRNTLNQMVSAVELEANIRRYGPMPAMP